MKRVYILTFAIFFSLVSNCINAQTTGTFKDKRDGKIYKTVKIGNQTWMAENLAYEINDCVAYENNYKIVNEYEYGFLYKYDEAKKVCPMGWHLPSKAEWEKLELYLSNNGFDGFEAAALKSKKWWDKEYKIYNDDQTGFSALPGGKCFKPIHLHLIFKDIQSKAYFWTSTFKAKDDAYYILLSSISNHIKLSYGNRYHGFSVRCIKD